MKYKGILIATIIFFLLINTSYFWEGKLGLLAFPVFIILTIVYLVFLILLIRQIYLLFKERFRNKQRIVSNGILLVVLILTLLYPTGLINFEKFEGEDILVAQAGGAANCTTTITLKNTNKFIERSVCFGVSETRGKYELKGDTIFFNDVKAGQHEEPYFEFAIIEKIDSTSQCLVRYENCKDTLGRRMPIIMNKLKEK